MVEDSPRDAELLIRELRQGGFDVKWERVDTEPGMREALGREPWDAVVSDHHMPRFDGFSALRVLHETGKDLPFIIVSGTIGEETAVAAMKAGAHDYLIKDRLARLCPTIGRELREARLRQERRVLDERLRQAARQWSVTFDAMNDPIFLLDADARIVRCNRAFRELVGKPEAQLLGRPCHEVVHGTPGPIEGCPFVALKRSRQRETMPFAIGDRVFDISVDPVLDEAGNLTGAVHVLLDVTRHKRAEAALRASEDKYRVLADNIIDVVYQLDIEGQIIHIGPQVARYGYRPEDLLHKSFLDVIHPDDRERLVQEFRETLSHNLVFLSQFRLLDSQGRTIWMEENGRTLRNAAGEPIGTTGVLRDITERKQADEVLKESEMRYRKLFEEAQDGMALAEADTGTLVDCNQALCRLVERDRAELVGQSQTVLHPPQDVAGDRSLSYKIHQKSTPDTSVEDRLMSKSGRIIPVEIRGARLRIGGQECLLGVFRDLTERKALEEKFLRTQRLESIGVLASGIAHDLNNVLMPLGLGVDVLRSKASAPEDIQLIDMMEQSAQRGANIIKQVLTFARGMRGEKGPLQIRHLARDVLGIVKETFPRNIRPVMDFPANLWTLTGDTTQLEQVLINLCVNARDAMPNGGTLTVQAENHVVDEQFAAMNPGARPGPHVLLSVKDTGTGMAPEVLKRIFDPFYTTKEVGKGSGLGLATAHGIIKNHGGFITVQTEVGAGSEFRIYLPADPEPMQPASPTSAPAAPKGHGELMLVVDDEEMVLNTLKLTLEKSGYRVVSADDGPRGVAVFAEQKSKIRAVIVDVGLPVMDGSAVARAIRSIAPAIPSLLMTGSPGRAVGLDLTAWPTLMKPFTRAQLLDTLRRLLAGDDSQKT